MSVEVISGSISTRYVAKLGFELVTLGSSVRHAIDCAVEPSFCLHQLICELNIGISKVLVLNINNMFLWRIKKNIHIDVPLS